MPKAKSTKITVTHSDVLLGTDAMFEIPAAWLEMVHAGIIDKFTMPVAECHSIFQAYHDTTLAGFMTYQPCRQDLWICMSYVRPNYRRCGVYTKLFHAAVDKARELKLQRIASGTHLTNEVMLKAYEKTGRKKNAEFWSFELPK